MRWTGTFAKGMETRWPFTGKLTYFLLSKFSVIFLFSIIYWMFMCLSWNCFNIFSCRDFDFLDLIEKGVAAHCHII